MPSEPYAESTREAVAVFETAEALEAAVDMLLSSGFNRADISLLAGEHAVEEKLGHLYKRSAELEDDPKAARTAYVSTEAFADAKGALIGSLTYVGAITAAGAMAAAGGPIAGTILAAAALGGAGGLLGSTLSRLLDQHHADHLRTQLEKGGLLLWVRTRDATHEADAEGILRMNGALDVHVHELSAGAA